MTALAPASSSDHIHFRFADHEKYSSLTNPEKIEFIVQKVFLEESLRTDITEEIVRQIEARMRKEVALLPDHGETEDLIKRSLDSFTKAIGRDPAVRQHNIRSTINYTSGIKAVLQREAFTEASLGEIEALHRTFIDEVIAYDSSLLEEEKRTCMKEYAEDPALLRQAYQCYVGSLVSERALILALLSDPPAAEKPQRALKVRFHALPGEALYIVSQEQGWDPSCATRLDPVEEDLWTLTGNIPDQSSWYKYLIGPWIQKGNDIDGRYLRWEHGDDRIGNTNDRPPVF